MAMVLEVVMVLVMVVKQIKTKRRIKMKKVIVDGEVFVKEETMSKNLKIVRTYSAGVFVGEIVERNDCIAGMSVVMKNARRLWGWKGAASLSQMATEGTKDPGGCKFPAEVKRVELFKVIEILDVTEQAVESINSVKVWSA